MSKNKHKFGKPKKKILDKKKVGKFLSDIGFESEKVIQEWRHLLAFGKYKSEFAVFKLASTQATSSMTQNEFFWNEAVHLVPEENRPNFTVPKNYDSGYFGKLFYFVAEWFRGDLITVKKIPQIVKATYELENLSIPPNCNFAKSSKAKRQKKVPVGQRFLASSSEWAEQVPRDLSDFLEVIKKSKGNLRTCVGHGDFVIRQMYDVDGKIGVIDGEHAGIHGPLYYDVAQFYIRLRNDSNLIEPARDYLMEFRKLLSNDDKKTFWEELKPVLIQRYIGDLWGAKNDEVKLKSLEKLGEEILNDEII